MSALEFRYVRGAIHLPALGLWLDAHRAIGAEEAVFVSHAHSDHTAAHKRVLFSPPTQKLMRARLAGRREEHALAFGQRVALAEFAPQAPASAALTLLPAGHIFGSAMSLIEADGESLLYTGDFKLRPSLSAELCEPRRADTLIMETTFGRPHYVLPPQADIFRDILDFCRTALVEGAVPVLQSYSLGKSQEILHALTEAGLPVMLSAPVAKMTRVYAEFGRTYIGWQPLEIAQAAGHVVISPPGANLDALKQQHVNVRTAVLTGWALDKGCHYRYGVEAAFPLSDHADYPDLLAFVRQVAPKRVFTLHGFAAEFATTLRCLGIEAWALGEANQLELPLG